MKIKSIILGVALHTSFASIAAQPTPAPVPKPSNGQASSFNPVAKPSMVDYCKQHTC